MFHSVEYVFVHYAPPNVNTLNTFQKKPPLHKGGFYSQILSRNRPQTSIVLLFIFPVKLYPNLFKNQTLCHT